MSKKERESRNREGANAVENNIHREKAHSIKENGREIEEEGEQLLLVTNLTYNLWGEGRLFRATHMSVFMDIIRVTSQNDNTYTTYILIASQ